MNNYQTYIFELIDGMVSGSANETNPIIAEIDNAYKLGYMDLDDRKAFKQYVKQVADEKSEYHLLAHSQKLYCMKIEQAKLKEQEQVKDLLSVADEEWRKQNVRVGRPRKCTISLSPTYK